MYILIKFYFWIKRVGFFIIIWISLINIVLDFNVDNLEREIDFLNVFNGSDRVCILNVNLI